MDKIVIEGATPLKGEVTVSGAKNAVLPILAATLLTSEKCVIKNVPHLYDVHTMVRILRTLGVRVQHAEDRLIIEPGHYKGYVAPYRLVSTMRASFCVLGPLLARQKKARVSLPGGCIIGARPVDLHIKGIRALGADLKIEKGYCTARAKELKGANIYLGGAFGPSCLGTANVMMAATLAKGKTVIEMAACEPEVVDLAEFLIKMGAKIKGHRTHRIEIEGVRKLGGVEHSVISDRIEAGTYLIAAGITGGNITIKNAKLEHLSAVADKLRQTGLNIKRAKNAVKVTARRKLRPVNVTTLPFPGFPTDLQAQMLSLMTVTDGISIITEKIYPDRFMHVSELGRMGARIALEGPSAIVRGVGSLSGAPVMASDLRASAALILAGLVAKSRTEIFRVYHLDRGYERLEEKLTKLGAKIWREKA